ncbi:antibiotic biosynthesis monooxygenase family protein [Benzoatithermus flavus]|uniref:Antibiotic biosynthesis monooxygenase family protein n=1 Tax=Benzoatithermus flavus TaxID=3108223 RepID=A0ABU8XWC4_9PROT
MRAVVFEFRPYPDQRAAYFALVAELRPRLLGMPGFLENERFQSIRDPGRLLSFQLWEDEAAIARWRAHPRHRVAQALGRSEIFQAYRLRVGEVIETDGPPGGADVVRLAFGSGLMARAGVEAFASITDARRILLVGSGDSPWDARAERRLVVRVIRDYGRGTLA